MRIAVCGTKGGSGKSTLAGLLALCFADVGKTIHAIDKDPQNTLSTWLRSIGGKATSKSGVPWTSLNSEAKDDQSDSSNLEWKKNCVWITDFPPASPDALLKMINASKGYGTGTATEGVKGHTEPWRTPEENSFEEWFDVLLVPCRPALADIWSIRSFLEKLDGYKGKVRLVMNALDNSSISKAGSIDTLLKGIKTPRTKATLSRRACYSYAMAGGWPALDEKAKSEVLSLALELSK
jgi:cellulose biosynthesis protein BcsQ